MIYFEWSFSSWHILILIRLARIELCFHIIYCNKAKFQLSVFNYPSATTLSPAYERISDIGHPATIPHWIQRTHTSLKWKRDRVDLTFIGSSSRISTQNVQGYWLVQKDRVKKILWSFYLGQMWPTNSCLWLCTFCKVGTIYSPITT